MRLKNAKINQRLLEVEQDLLHSLDAHQEAAKVAVLGSDEFTADFGDGDYRTIISRDTKPSNLFKHPEDTILVSPASIPEKAVTPPLILLPDQHLTPKVPAQRPDSSPAKAIAPSPSHTMHNVHFAGGPSN